MNSTTDKTVSALTIAVVGARGMLGSDLVPILEERGFRVVPLNRPEIDITRPESVSHALDASRADLVINCAAYTAVDKAESEPEMAFAVNRDGAANLARSCKALGIPLIHISTDYVFDGTLNRPYREDDTPNPINVYGKSKWEGEEAIRSILDEHIIVRTSWLYGAHGKNFVKTIIKLAREREELRVVDDQYGCPTWTVNLAHTLLAMAERTLKQSQEDIRGLYHFCGKGVTTWYGLAKAIMESANQHMDMRAKRVLPIPSSEYPTPARRPAWSVLDCRKLESCFGVVAMDWKKGLLDAMLSFGVF